MTQPDVTRWRLRGTVSGRVQGVGFRLFVRRAGEELGADGWVRNLPSRQVELDAAGPRPAMEELQRRVAKGPFFARVTETSLILEPADDASPRPGSGFQVVA